MERHGQIANIVNTVGQMILAVFSRCLGGLVIAQKGDNCSVKMPCFIARIIVSFHLIQNHLRGNNRTGRIAGVMVMSFFPSRLDFGDVRPCGVVPLLITGHFCDG